MSVFFRGRGASRYGLLIDIGSGSVLISIVATEPDELHPIILWAVREHVPLGINTTIEQTAKAVMTALMSALLQFESAARSTLHTYDARATITDIQIVVAAPWSYTITKHIHYRKDEPFQIDKPFLSSLVDTAQHKIDTELKEHEMAANLDLAIVLRTVLAVIANGYSLTSITKQKATEVTIIYGSAVIQEQLASTIADVHQKIAPRATPYISSFMLAFDQVRALIKPHWDEVCLVDLTYEATEIGLVRAGSIRYCTHTPLGSRTLARTIAHETKTPVADVMSRMQGQTPDEFVASFSTRQQTIVQNQLDAYQAALTELFGETGDALAIPKQLLFHTEQALEPFFTPLLLAAAKQSTKITHHSAPATSLIIDHFHNHPHQHTKTDSVITDTAMLVSALFFHNRAMGTSETQDFEGIL
jgi:hypothetical protein